MTEHLGTLPIARLRLTVRADAPLHLPPYAGSMLRGAFGHALLALAPLPHHGGQPCALHASCPYCQVFASPPLPAHSLQKFSQMPAPYVIEPPEGGAQRLSAGQAFDFGLVLIGKALTHIGAIERAWQRALRIGLGHEHAPCTLVKIHDENGEKPFEIMREKLSKSIIDLPPAPTLTHRATLHFHTPLRLQIQGKPARAHQLTARHLLITLARRWQLLQDVHLGAAAPQQDFAALSTQASAITLQAHGLRWYDWGRYSQRQQREMQLGGLLGSLHLHGELSPFAHLLHLGQWLHLGKNTSFGLGGYRLQLEG
ncbi:MAG: CRISPR system precrRNA processing endoribonuclease RAMP protein Cas6 [Pseudomonadota bacterium]|nr:CRISPR system precrRNA processing endoribonuclease RAMP protein Cas6 [Pseudomonadota bacterium]